MNGSFPQLRMMVRSLKIQKFGAGKVFLKNQQNCLWKTP